MPTRPREGAWEKGWQGLEFVAVTINLSSRDLKLYPVITS